MDITKKEKKVLEIISHKEYATISDFLKIYKEKHYASASFERFAKVLKVVKLEVCGKFRVDHKIVNDLIICYNTTTSKSIKSLLKEYCDMKEKKLRRALDYNESDHAIILANIELLNEIRGLVGI